MNLKEELKDMTPEEIRDHLAGLAVSAEKDADKLKALELLAKINGLIKHGNVEKKDYREIVIGSHTKAGEGSMKDQ